MSLCRPRKPFDSWQLTDQQHDIPRWLLPFLTGQASGRIDFTYPDNGGQFEMKPGDWAVRLSDDIVEHFTAEEFLERFETSAASSTAP